MNTGYSLKAICELKTINIRTFTVCQPRNLPMHDKTVKDAPSCTRVPRKIAEHLVPRQYQDRCNKKLIHRLLDIQPLPPKDFFAADRAARKPPAAPTAHARMAAGDERHLDSAHHAHIAVAPGHPRAALPLLPPALKGHTLLV